MFTLDPIHPIYSAVIEAVAVSPQITIGDLHEHLKKHTKMEISLAHLYRVVTRMVDKQILIKMHGTLTLNLMWVSYVEFIAGRAKRILQHADDFPLKEGEKRVYPAKSLFDVEAIWNHVLISLYRVLHEKTLYKYYSHAWWQLGRNAEEISFYKRLKESGIDCHWVFGSESFLDGIGAARVGEVFPAIAMAHPPFPTPGYNLNVYGDYIVECILPDKISRHFSLFFDTVQDMKAFDEELFLDVFSVRGNFKVSVWRNARQAQALRETLIACV